MITLRRIPTRLVLVLAAALLLASLSAASEAGAKKKNGGPPVGVWAGTATYTSPPEGEGGGIEYESAIVLTTERDRAGNVRLSGFLATVRTYCLSGIRDIRVLKYDIPKGPKLSGGGRFSYTTQGVTVSGQLGRPFGSGRLRASAAGCDLTDGVWKAKKRKF